MNGGQRRQRYDLDWMGPHGTVHGTINAASGALAVAMIGDLIDLRPWWAIVGALVGAGTTQLVSTTYARATQVYRGLCWIGVGLWGGYALATTPWSVTSLASLTLLGLAAGVLAPGFAKAEVNAENQHRRVMLIKERDALGREWESRIARVAKIPRCEVVGYEPWPKNEGVTPGFDLDIELPEGGYDWTSLRAHSDGLAADARLPVGCGVEIEQGSHRRAAIAHVSTLNVLSEYRTMPREYGHTTINNPVWLGWYRDAKDVAIRIRERTMMYVGQKGKGKTTALNVLIAQLSRTVDTIIWVIDMNAGSVGVQWAVPWWEDRAPRPTVDWIAGDGDEALLMTEAALAVMYDRKIHARTLKRKRNVTLMPVSPKLPALIIVVDEGAEVLGERSSFRQVKENLAELQRLGRDAGILPEVSSLRGTADMIDTSFKSQSEVRILFGVADDSEVAHTMDWGSGASVADVPYDGCALIRDGNGAPIRAMKSPDILPNQIEEVAIATSDRRPELDRRGVDAITERIGPGVYEQRWNRATRLFTEAHITAGAERTSPVTRSGRTGGDEPDVNDPIWGTREVGSIDDKIKELRDAVTPGDDGSPDAPTAVDPDVRSLEEVWKIDAYDPRESSEDDVPDVENVAPAGQRPPRVRMLELLAEAGDDGLTPSEIVDLLAVEGYTTVRQTITRWIGEERDGSGLVERSNVPGKYRIRHGNSPRNESEG